MAIGCRHAELPEDCSLRLNHGNLPAVDLTFNNLFRPNQAPAVNVVAVILVAVSILPFWLAQRLSGTEAAESRL